MAPKTVEEQLAELEFEAQAPPKAPPKSSSKPKAARGSSEREIDALKELEELEALEKFERPEPARPSSRPNTPKLPSSSTTSRNRSPRRTGIATPSSTGSTRTSEDNKQQHPPRKSGESTRSFHQGFSATDEEPKPQATPEPEPPKASGGGWWGGLLSTASAAVKQAENAVKEIQKNEEAQRWAEQVKGNVGALRGIGGELRSRAIPTFTNILHTLAPPISQHERLQIHITHDLVGYPSLDPIIYQTFSTVMSQVEGGDLLVIQRGSESTHRRASDAGYTGGSSGWNDGPWWRQADKRDLSVVKGLVEGTKLARVSAEAYATDFFAPKGGVEEAAKQATEILSESNPVRSSDIFLSLQAISYPVLEDLFGGSVSADAEKTGGVEEPKECDDLVAFAIYLHDPIHSITFKTLSQGFPLKWVEWVDAHVPPTEAGQEQQLPEEIMEIIQSGGVDPREWVADWMEEVINLSVGVIAQRYVARRMGVGEGGIGRGKAREMVVEAGGGEAARAGL
ncbi:hypothetical protein BU16DRAFT_528087 [Lophium mytilinum]|uniref:Maintenance of telomere capping protein 1 n=1 Tax=Lophium mytilinum TaxID=390894 RepID=A0A6A6QNB1_9PEZI|nr:hypothetical protein BU16DRAFT_528087 [Lophium mytilinum]